LLVANERARQYGGGSQSIVRLVGFGYRQAVAGCRRMMKIDHFEPGQRVVVVQQIPLRDRVWTTRVSGRVVRSEQKKTGSWYAHAKGDRLWLDRLVMEKDDGEIVDCILDEYTHVELMPEPVKAAAAAAGAPVQEAAAAEMDAGESEGEAEAKAVA
jgi:hypothetical protein